MWLATPKGGVGQESQVRLTLLKFRARRFSIACPAGRSSCDASQVPNTLHEGIKQLRVAVAGFGMDLHITVVEDRSWSTDLAEACAVRRTKAEFRPTGDNNGNGKYSGDAQVSTISPGSLQAVT